MRSLRIICLCVFETALVLSFSPTVNRPGVVADNNSLWSLLPRRPSTFLCSTNRDEEIAKLQEQIRQLQEAKDEPSSDLSNEQEQVASRLVDKRSAELERVRGKDSPFTEGDLIDANILEADDSSTSLNLPLVLLGIGAVIFLGLFSQVPVGQEDLSRYSVAPPTQVIDLGDINPEKASK